MAAKTEISWCDATFNCWIGCTKVSPGCDNCYAEARMDTRLHRVHWGAGQPRVRTQTWNEPLKWNREPFFECPDCGKRGSAKEMGDEPKACKHLNAKPARARVFCASLADVFDNEVLADWRIDLWDLCDATPNLDKLLLTKRIGNVKHMVPLRWMQPGGWPKHVWIGATVVNQEEADRDIPKLLALPAPVRFLSMEPLLGRVVLPEVFLRPLRIDGRECAYPDGCGLIDWVIVGGESGPKARPMHLQWVRDIVRQCRAAGVAVQVKQLGREVMDDGMSSPGEHWPTGKVRTPVPRRTDADPAFVVRLQDRKGGDMAEWPEDLRVREFPHA